MEVDEHIGGIFSQGLGVKNSHGIAKDFYQCVGRIVVPGMLICAHVGTIRTPWNLGSGIVQVPSKKSDAETTIYMVVQKVCKANFNTKHNFIQVQISNLYLI